MTRKEMVAAIASPTMKRIMESGRMPVILNMGAENLQILKEYFDANPDVETAYYFYNGRIIEEMAYSRSLSSRTAQLVAIANDGFPMLVSRWAVEYCLAE